VNFVPKQMFFTKGVGEHKEKLVSFEMALRKAGIAEYNLVRVSSIFPPKCKIVNKTVGLAKLNYGQVVFCVMSDCAVKERNRLAVASVGVAIPQNGEHGYLSEHHAHGQTDQFAGDYAEDLAAEMLATTLGIPFETKLHWDKRKNLWKLGDEIVKTTSVTQSVIGKDDVWSTVVSAAILIL